MCVICARKNLALSNTNRSYIGSRFVRQSIPKRHDCSIPLWVSSLVSAQLFIREIDRKTRRQQFRFWKQTP